MSFRPEPSTSTLRARLAELRSERIGPFHTLPSVEDFNKEYFTGDLDKCKITVLDILNAFATRKTISILREIKIKEYVTIRDLLAPYSISVRRITASINADKANFEFRLDPNKISIFNNPTPDCD